MWAFSSCGTGASHCGGFSCCGAWALGSSGFRGCGTWAWLPRSMSDLPGPGIEPVSSVLAGGFLTTGPPGKSSWSINFFWSILHKYNLRLFRVYSEASQVTQWVKNSPASTRDTGDMGSIPRWATSPGVGDGNLLQYCCLENPVDRGPWWAAVHGVAKSWTWLSNWACTCTKYTMWWCNFMYIYICTHCERFPSCS